MREHADSCYWIISQRTSQVVWIPGFRDRITSVCVPFGWREMVGCQAL